MNLEELINKHGPDGIIPLFVQGNGRFSGPDGIKVDQRGNVWFGGPGGLWVVSPEGARLGLIRNERNINLAFGDADGKGLYITTFTGLVRIRLNSSAR